MKVHAPYLGAGQETLGITPEKEQCGIGWLAFIEQMQVGENIN